MPPRRRDSPAASAAAESEFQRTATGAAGTVGSNGTPLAGKVKLSAIESLPGALVGESAGLGLDGAVQGATQSLLHRMDRLERRLVAGIKRRETALLADVGTLRAALYPKGTRQERALNLIPTLSRHGLGVLSEMRDAAASHARTLIERA